MLAEVLYRRLTLLTLTAAAVTMVGCAWDGQGDGLGEFTSARVTAEESAVTDGEDSSEDDTPSEEEIAEDTAMALVEKWLGLLAEGDAKSADELVSPRIRAVDEDLRLFNTDFPKAADITRYAPSVVRKDAYGYTVTLKVIVTPHDDPESKVNADILVSIDSDGGAAVEYVTEIGSTAMRSRRVMRRAKQAYECAVNSLANMEKKTWSGMHHMGEGSRVTDDIEERLHPAKSEDFSVAVRDGEVMYVSWTDGGITERYPKAEEYEDLRESEPERS